MLGNKNYSKSYIEILSYKITPSFKYILGYIIRHYLIFLRHIEEEMGDAGTGHV